MSDEFWPGTNIPKSKGDAFDWRNTASIVMNDKEWRHGQFMQRIASQAVKMNKTKSFTIYSKAKVSK